MLELPEGYAWSFYASGGEAAIDIHRSGTRIVTGFAKPRNVDRATRRIHKKFMRYHKKVVAAQEAADRKWEELNG